MNKTEFWENPIKTRGFASCDKCAGGEMQGKITFQNGKITLCEAHYRELGE